MRVSDLIKMLSDMPQDADVQLRPQNAMSRPPRPQLGEGFRSPYLQTLNDQYFGFSDAKAAGESFPVVWL
jgi:hypothetical protein